MLVTIRIPRDKISWREEEDKNVLDVKSEEGTDVDSGRYETKER